MIDEARVLWRLRNVTHDVAVLRAEASAGDERRTDPIWLRGVKYAFVTATQCCADVARHLCDAEGWGPPGDDRDAMRLLGDRDVVTTELAASMREWMELADRLVRENAERDDPLVVERLADLGDFELFVEATAQFVERRA